MTRIPNRLALFPACVALAPLACASVASEVPPDLTEIWRQFLEMPRERALAIAGDPDYLWVGAAVGGYTSTAEAKRGAIEECNKRRVQRRMQSPCRLYAVGSEIVRESW